MLVTGMKCVQCLGLRGRPPGANTAAPGGSPSARFWEVSTETMSTRGTLAAKTTQAPARQTREQTLSQSYEHSVL